MLCIKIVDNNGIILSAEKIEEPEYVRWQSKNSIYVRCTETEAQGVISIHGSKIYQLLGKTEMPGEHLIAEPTSEANCENLIQALEIQETISQVQNEPPEEQTESIMTASEMRTKILALTEQVDFLENCILEMSETVYS